MTGSVALRVAGAGDLEDLLRLARAFYDEDGFTTSDAELRKNFTVLLAAADAHVVVAIDDGLTCAFALTTTAFILESGLVAEVQDLYVDPTHRGHGVARALVDDAAAWAQAQGARQLEVVIAPNGRDVAHLFRFYARLGFTDEGRRLLSRQTSSPPDGR